MTNAEYLAWLLEERRITHAFHVIGGMTTFLVDAIMRARKTRLIALHHEQAAAFAAEGWARMKGLPGVAMATSGPGATNLLTGIASCFFDSTPAVFITGQVNRDEQKGARLVRQGGFQETDIVSLARPITKAALPWTHRATLQLAFMLAAEGRSGPVLLDATMDFQRAPAGDSMLKLRYRELATNDSERSAFIKKMLDAHVYSKRSLILAGGGVRTAGAVEAFADFARHLQIPVVHSLMGVDLLPASNGNRVGMIGTYGNRWANLALARADNLIVLGSRLDVRQTGSDVASWSKGKRIYHVDCDVSETNNRVKDCEVWCEQLRPFLEAAVREIPQRVVGPRRDWWNEISDFRMQCPDTREQLPTLRGINPNEFMRQLSLFTRDAAAYVCDVGQHQMWAAQSLQLDAGQRFLTSGGMGAMGWALPAAIGAWFATDGAPIVMIAGDGGFQLNIQELETIARLRLPIKMIVINNRSLGMVRQLQDALFEGRHYGTIEDYGVPDFVGVASGYLIEAETIETPAQVQRALARMMQTEGPYLLEVSIDTSANAYPKLAFGKPFPAMEPWP
jgi:acetolactate synthase-1/2/3 large subunit